MLVKYGKTKNIIAKIAKIMEIFVDFSIPILIARVLTPSFSSPSTSSHPLIISRDSKRKNEVKKNNKYKKEQSNYLGLLHRQVQ